MSSKYSSSPEINGVENDWRMTNGSFHLRYSEARKRNLFTDVECVVGEGKFVKSFSAHRFMLACASPMFERILYGPEYEKDRHVPFPNDDPEAFEMLMGYIYEESVPIESITRACKYHTIASRYFILEPQSAAIQFVKSTKMEDFTFWEIIAKNLFFHPLLQSELISYIERHVKKIINSKHFVKLRREELEYILRMDILDVDEFSLLRAATKWVWHKFGESAGLKKLKPLLRHIRFSVLTSEQFWAFDEEYPNAIGSKIYFDILNHLLNRSEPLPNWCCSRRDSRLLPDLSFLQEKFRQL